MKWHGGKVLENNINFLKGILTKIGVRASEDTGSKKKEQTIPSEEFRVCALHSLMYHTQLQEWDWSVCRPVQYYFSIIFKYELRRYLV